MTESDISDDKIIKQCISDTSAILFARTEDSIFQEATKEINKFISNKGNTGTEDIPEDGEIVEHDKTTKEDLQKQVQCGEITPFQALRKEQDQIRKDDLNGKQTNKVPELLDFEKYLKQQAELAKRRKQHLQQKLKNLHQQEHCPTSTKKLKLMTQEKSTSKHKKCRSKQKNFETSSGNLPAPVISIPKEIMEQQTRDYIQMSNEENEIIPTVSSQATEKRGRAKEDMATTKEIYDSDSDYVPSDDHSDSDGGKQKNTSRKKGCSMKSHFGRTTRILDDGDEASYRYRIETGGYNKRKEAFHRIDNLFKVPKIIWKRLYRYQRVSVQWLWELHGRGFGGLLGDEMGLGKTVQVIAFLAGLDFSELLSDGGRFRGLGPTLIICPATLMEQWVMHFHDWWPILRVAVLHQAGTYDGDVKHLLHSLKESGGVLVTSYSGVLIHKDTLVRFQWHYVILDEGHKIRNPEAKVTKTVKAFSTPHRLLLTGSPMQNSLKELWSLFDFILPGKLGTLVAFLEHVANPITRGGYANASALQEATALQVATILKDAITPYMLRRTKTDVQHHVSLPQKNEQVLFCSLTDEQKRLYKTYLRSEDVALILHDRVDVSGRYKARLLIALSSLRKICNHPDLYLYTRQLDSDEDIDENNLTGDPLDNFGYWKRSGKMVVVRSLLKIWKKQNHRVLLFTQGRQMMHILESLLQNEEYTYLRMDGTTPMSQRQQTISLFNENDSYFVFLLTTRVGGLGVNLTGANRVIIYDPDWNPATDAQARERAWRIGQDKRVTIYRLITAGTIEEKMYHRQIFKLLLSNKVLEDPRQRRLFKTSDLAELFNLNECISGEASESDRLFHESKLTPTTKSLSSTTEFSQTKIEEMRRLASTLSKAMVHCKNSTPGSDEHNGKKRLKDEINDSDIMNTNSAQNKDVPITLSNCSSHKNKNIETKQQPKKTETQKKKKRDKKSSNKKDGESVSSAMFEGERVSYLIGRRLAKSTHEDEELPTTTEEDHYVLKKLFAKSTVSSAFQHDSVLLKARNVNDNTDVTPMQRLARETAEQNMDFVRQSRKWCWKPTWEHNSATKND